MMKAKLIITTLFLLGSATAVAEQTDSILYKVDSHSDLVESLRSGLYSNPAMQSFHHSSSLNNISLGYSGQWATSPIRPEYGTGHNMAIAHVDAYLRKKDFTLWGEVDYNNGQTQNIVYNETADFDIIYPYVTADTVGGSTKQEHYYFMGGFAWQKGRFTIGAEGSYTAKMEYRTRDPRPKNLTGDLKVRVGGTYDVGGGQVAGLAVSARRYKQTNELELYNETSVPIIYHPTGLGNDYYRFRGVNTDTYYKGYSVGSTATFAHKDKHGLFASIGYNYFSFEKIISDLNQLPMAEVKEHSQTAVVGYTGGSAANSFGLALSESYTCRRGTENIFGTSQNNIYPQISSATLYENEKLTLGLKGIYSHGKVGQSSWNVSVDGGYTDNKESYAEPERSMRSSAIYGGIGVGGRLYAGRMLFIADAGMKYYDKQKAELVGVSADDGGLAAATMQMYDYYDNDRLTTNVRLEADCSMKSRYVIYMAADWEYAKYSESQHSNAIEISIGVRF